MTIDRALRILYLRLRSLLRRSDVEQELDDELRYHVEQQTAENVRQGMTPEDARHAALRAIGGVSYRKEQVRDTRGTRWLEEIGGDVAFAMRSLRRARGFAIAVVVTLALGIGVNTAMFTLLRGTLLRSLPNREGDRLVYLRQSAAGAGQADVLFSVPEVGDYRTRAKTLAAVAEYSSSLPFTLVDERGQPARVRAAVISGNYFDVVGLSPALGRLPGIGDDGPSATPIAVLSHKYWIDHFGGDSAVIGRTVRLNDFAVTVVGVVQPAPDYPRPTDIFVNTVASPHHLSAAMVTSRSHRMSRVFARLAPNATIEDARREIKALAASMRAEHAEAYEKAARYEVTTTQLRDAVNERASMMFWLLMGAAAFVLLIACANVANLTLMRGIGREREMLVRAALGAGSVRLRRLLIVENLTLALVGGAMGVLVAFAALRLLVSFAAQFSPRAHEIRIDGIVLGVGLATSVAAALILSFLPRIGGQRTVAAALTPGKRSTSGRSAQRLQRSLVVVQLAVSMVLLTGAGLLVRTLGKLQAVDSGLRVERVLTMDLPIDGDLLREVAKQPEYLARYERIRDRVAALPGVDVAAVGVVAPLRTAMLDLDIKAEGRVVAPNRSTPHAAMRSVDPQYLAAAGIPLVAGRSFTTTDRRGTAPVVILNRTLARQLFGDENPIGRRIAWTGPILRFTPVSPEWRTVVGVVGDTRDEGLDSAPTPTVFQPFAQEFIPAAALVVRTTNDPALLQQAVIRAVRELYPRQLIERVATLEQVRDATVAPRRLNALFIAAFSALAFIIAMVGIAGVLAFSVSARTAEIGIRMSLGADASRVRRMILGEGSLLLAAGLLMGTAGALVTTRLLRGLLFGVSPYDPTTLGIVAVALMAVGAASCWLPAARAARVDPAIALRAE